MTPELSGRRGILPASAAFFAILAAAALVSPRGFWIMDEAFGFLQVAGLESGGFRLPPAIPYPGAELLGPHASSLRPLPYHFGSMSGGSLYCQYSPLFAILSVPGHLALGRPGILLVPAISCLILALFAAPLLEERGFGRIPSLSLVFFGTPVLFYGLCGWSHATALALCAAAWAAFRRSEGSAGLIVPFLLVLCASLLREECLAFLPVLAFAGGRKRIAVSFAALALSALAFVSAQRLLTGSWLGTHLASSGSEQAVYGFSGLGFFERKLFVFRTTLLSCIPGAGPVLQSAAGLILWAVWAMSRGGGRKAAILSASGCLASAALCVSGARGGFPLLAVMELKHPLVVIPALWLAGKPDGRWVAPAAVLAALVLSMEPMHAQDAAWGSRLLLAPLIMLAMVSARPPRTIVPVSVACLAATAVSLGFLAAKRERSGRLVEEAGRLGGAVVATSWELPGEFAELQAEGAPVVFADSTAEFALALTALGPLHPVVASPAEDLVVVTGAARAAGIILVPAVSIRFDPALEAVLLVPAGAPVADPAP
ncbi:hypothetical protein GX411_08755 [Candidatus Fermentibacteria bacterium]|nr:hypothetical protein [Candidatus Fermentibacteria bacterium]